ncbi:hypothetical protein PsAD2_03882 [Pseudovibrio axinellae]|uniref:Type VI secretion protein, VC_A0111 family n=1 Tax=Pseudovibrio axinellae TaxID=989403 RepID=A0A165UMU1_9HYPH|nr:type VI secretion system baseplate subunit TssG [Pseudovibrio axinellae]KZL12576.1 hypothetical protein PsAD2_03882 [Pseudovibrio axinellae]SEP66099.1 type VI secretion system protein ImpH [Pseudovibrio axinellae]
MTGSSFTPPSSLNSARDAKRQTDARARWQPPAHKEAPLSARWKRRFQLAEKDYLSYEFLPLVRLIECAHPNKPRIGTSRRCKDDPVRFSHEPHLQFEATTITAFKQSIGAKPNRLTSRFLGLFGPNGPMPLHLTGYAFKREHQHRDTTMRAFADVFHHRVLSLFYRAAVTAEPAFSFDRPDDDRFSVYTGSIAGFGPTEFRHRDKFPDVVKYHFTARLALQTRNCEGLLAILSSFFNLPVDLEEFIGEWLYLPKNQVTTLNGFRNAGVLGVGAALGARVWSSDTKFRVVFGPLCLHDYERLLPDGVSMPRLLSAVRAYCGDELEWDVTLVLKREQTPKTHLGQYGKLGWTTWLSPQKHGGPVRDLNLRPREIVRKSKMTNQSNDRAAAAQESI